MSLNPVELAVMRLAESCIETHVCANFDTLSAYDYKSEVIDDLTVRPLSETTTTKKPEPVPIIGSHVSYKLHFFFIKLL